MNCSDCKNTGKQICTVCCTYQGGVPDRWEPKPVTHYDLIISKTPEELAEWIAQIADCCGNDYCGKSCPLHTLCWSKCSASTLDWLKQEVKE